LTDTILLAGTAESNSEHPIGGAISTFAKEVGFKFHFIYSEHPLVSALSTMGIDRQIQVVSWSRNQL
jgi:cation transport ATPase